MGGEGEGEEGSSTTGERPTCIYIMALAINFRRFSNYQALFQTSDSTSRGSHASGGLGDNTGRSPVNSLHRRGPKEWTQQKKIDNCLHPPPAPGKFAKVQPICLLKKITMTQFLCSCHLYKFLPWRLSLTVINASHFLNQTLVLCRNVLPACMRAFSSCFSSSFLFLSEFPS